MRLENFRFRALGSGALLVAASAFVFVPGGCSSEEGDVLETLGTVDELAARPPADVAIPFEEFQDDVGGQAARETRVLIRSRAGYESYFGHAPPASVDFSREWVIFYAAGTKSTGGYRASVLSLSRAGQELLAVTRLVSPGPGCAVTLAFTTPHVLVKFAAQRGTSIRFKRSDQTLNCDDPLPNACAAVLCPVGTHCEVQEVVCITTPCPPIVQCVADAPPKDPCAAILCGPGTHCEARDVQCITAPCPPVGECVPDLSACAAILCPANTKCVPRDVQCITTPCPPAAECVPIEPPKDPCATVRCEAGTHCEAKDVVCITAPCPPVAECVPDLTNPCAAALCPVGTRCEVKEVQCIRAPCPPVAECVPIGGGACGKTTCPADQYCCNASCGICAPAGAACIQIACDDTPRQ